MPASLTASRTAPAPLHEFRSHMRATPRATWFLLVVIAGLLVALYAGTATRLAGQWLADPNYSHGWLVPCVSGWLAWRAVRSRVLGELLSGGTAALGGLEVLAGCLIHLAAQVVQWPVIEFVATVLILRGLALAIGGRGLAQA